MSGLNQLIRELRDLIQSPKDAPKFAVKPEVWIELHPPEQSSNHSTPCRTSPVSDSLVNIHTSTPLSHLSQQCNPAMYSFGNVSDIIDQDSLSIDSPVSSPLALFE